MVTILFVIGQLGLGGGEKQLYLQLKYLDRQIFNPIVVSFNPGAGDYWEQPILDLGIDIYFVEKSFNKFKRLRNFYKIVKKLNPKIIQSCSVAFNFPVSLVGNLLHIPFIIGSVRQNLFRKGENPRTAFDRYISIVGIDYFLSNSTQGQRDLIKLGIDKSKIHVLFNGIETFADSTFDLHPDDLRESWGASPDDLVIGTICSLHWVKNLDFLLLVFKSLLEKYENLFMVIFGDGPEYENLLKASKDLKIERKIKLLGRDPNAFWKIKGFDVFCFTSISEGMPNALIEAAISGLPIVTSDIGGARDIVVDGKSGFICEDYQVKTYVKYISLLLDHPQMRRDFGLFAEEFAKKRFDVNKIGSEFNGFYKTILDIL